MALWAKTQTVPAESSQQVHEIYSGDFPIEVRHFLATWIEEKFWELESQIAKNDGHQEHYIRAVIHNLIAELEKVALSLTTENLYLAKAKLLDTVKMYKHKYAMNPVELYSIIRNCLAAEVHLVSSFATDFMNNFENLPISNYRMDILEKLDEIKVKTEKTAENLRHIILGRESYTILYEEFGKIAVFLQQNIPPDGMTLQEAHNKKESLQTNLSVKLSNLMARRLALEEKFKENIDTLNVIQSKILDEELISWKRRQQLAGNGLAFNDNLSEIQKWCEELARYIWKNRQQIKDLICHKLQAQVADDALKQLLDQVTQLLSSLVTSSFIIEKQPPQVLKTNTRIQSIVRLLVGGVLDVHMSTPEVRVSIISENQANALLKNDKMSNHMADSPSGEILNSTGIMEYMASTRQLSVSFRNMQLKKIKRAEKKSTDSVMDEKFSLFFQSKFCVGGGELMFQVWTLSLPVVVIVHGNQEPHALATITWDNAFAAQGRIPFLVTEKVPWSSAAEMLSIRFKAATDRALSEANLNFLAKKVFRDNYIDPTQILTWSTFCKDTLIERGFTFWEWFYSVMKLTREHLKALWINNLIHGFIQKKEAEEMLSASQNDGTFLLRFSDSELGGITIACIDKGEVVMVQPFTSKDFGIRSLSDRINDLEHLRFLYPNIPKDKAFGQYYSRFEEEPTTTKSSGYVKPMLKTHLPGWSDSSSNYSNPNTPQPSSFMSSPDYKRETPSANGSCSGFPTVNPASVASVPAAVFPSENLNGQSDDNSSGMDYMNTFDNL